MVHVVWALRKRLKDLLEVYTMEQDVMDNQSGWSNNKRKGTTYGDVCGCFYFPLFHDIFGDSLLHSLMEELELENTGSSQNFRNTFKELFYKFHNHYFLI